ncbi:hypothetical protein TRSC58_07523 [Trypanosoma rangeli SC58]|uniref:Uncharacterized protein n=1 Tax=Trypanosoma rangeli SC58 TaxID=429131 RepID=A0A061IRW3_TRYRA|nr:hypothetical protein TRSC58_07523 [Trypanosoma rangeli SC58]
MATAHQRSLGSVLYCFSFFFFFVCSSPVCSSFPFFNAYPSLNAGPFLFAFSQCCVSSRFCFCIGCFMSTAVKP